MIGSFSGLDTKALYHAVGEIDDVGPLLWQCNRQDMCTSWYVDYGRRIRV